MLINGLFQLLKSRRKSVTDFIEQSAISVLIYSEIYGKLFSYFRRERGGQNDKNHESVIRRRFVCPVDLYIADDFGFV